MATAGEYTIREAQLSDVPAMVALRVPGDTEGVPSADRMRGYLAGELFPQRALRARVVLVAEVERQIVGYIAGHLTRRYGCDGELEWLYVAYGARRQGLATALLHALAAWFVTQAAHQVCVNVHPGNAAARAFYLVRGARVLNPHWLVWDDVGTAVGGTSAL